MSDSFTAADLDAARTALARVESLQDARVRRERDGDIATAVSLAGLVHDILNGLTPAQLRAVAVVLTTPEARRSIPVVVGPGGATVTPTAPPDDGLEQLWRDSRRDLGEAP